MVDWTIAKYYDSVFDLKQLWNIERLYWKSGPDKKRLKEERTIVSCACTVPRQVTAIVTVQKSHYFPQLSFGSPVIASRKHKNGGILIKMEWESFFSSLWRLNLLCLLSPLSPSADWVMCRNRAHVWVLIERGEASCAPWLKLMDQGKGATENAHPTWPSKAHQSNAHECGTHA